MYSSKWKGKENHDILIILFQHNKSKSFTRTKRKKKYIYFYFYCCNLNRFDGLNGKKSNEFS